MIAARSRSLWRGLRGVFTPPTIYLFERPDLLNPRFRFYVGNNSGKRATDIGSSIGTDRKPDSDALLEFVRVFNEGVDGKYIPIEDKYGCVEVSFGDFFHPGSFARITYGHPDIDNHLRFQPPNRRRVSGRLSSLLPRPISLKIMRNGAESGVDVLDHEGHIWTFVHCRLLIRYNDGVSGRDRLYTRIMNEIIVLPDGGILLVND